MKALVIRQPWAQLILDGKKTIEIRGRRTSVREPFLIVAGKTIDELGMALHGPRPLLTIPVDRGLGISQRDLERLADLPMIAPSWAPLPIDTSPGAINGTLPTGVAIATARIYKVEPMKPELEIEAMCPLEQRKYDAGFYAWHLGNVKRISPFKVRGMPGFFDVDVEEMLL